jgi:hypothetical protein
MERKMNTSRLKERYESPTVEKCQVMLEQMMAGSHYVSASNWENIRIQDWDEHNVSPNQDITIDFN